MAATLLPHRINHKNPMESYKEGYMVKKGHKRRNWNRRFFVLREGFLYYFDNEETARVSVEKQKAPKGT